MSRTVTIYKEYYKYLNPYDEHYFHMDQKLTRQFIQLTSQSK